MDMTAYSWGVIIFTAISYPLLAWYVKKDTTKKPKFVSFVIWTIADIVILRGLYMTGQDNPQIWVMTIGTGLLAVYLSSYADRGFVLKDDLPPAIAALFMLFLWVANDNPWFSIVMSFIVIALGAVPLIKSVWGTPQNEPMLPWITMYIGSVCQVLDVKSWALTDVEGWIQPAFFLALQTFTVGLIVANKQTKWALRTSFRGLQLGARKLRWRFAPDY